MFTRRFSKWASLFLLTVGLTLPASAHLGDVYTELCIDFTNLNPVYVIILGTAEVNFSNKTINASRTYFWNYWATSAISTSAFAQPYDISYADFNSDGYTDARLSFTKRAVWFAGFDEKPPYGRLHMRTATGTLFVLFPRIEYSPKTPTNTPTNTSTKTPTNTPTNTSTKTPTWTPANTPTNTHTPTNTPIDTPTVTDTPTDTPTLEPTLEPTLTSTPTLEPTLEPTLTSIPTLEPTLTFTPTLEPTFEPTAIPTSTFTPQQESTLIPTATLTSTPTVTSTPTSMCSSEAPIDLGAAGDFVVLAGSTITNVVNNETFVTGNMGVHPGTAVVGFPPGTLNGQLYVGDETARLAKVALTTAYNDAAERATDPTTVAGNLGGQTLYPCLYKSTSSLEISEGDLILDAQGDPNAVFIFQMASTLTVISDRQVILIGGARASNIFWQVGSSATIGTNSVFKGILLVETSITFETGATLDGRALAQNGAVTLDSNTILVVPEP